jgi:hypothetical protein
MIADFREMNITLKIQRKFIPYSLFFAGSRRRRRSLSSRIDFCACVSFIFIYLFIYLFIFKKIPDEPRWFKDHTKEAYGFIGGTVNMTCSAVAEPGADFIWIKDNKTIHPSEDVQIFNSDHHSSLQLYIYDDSVFGDYECRATNMLGTMARVIVLEQAIKPAAPTFKIKVNLDFIVNKIIIQSI